MVVWSILWWRRITSRWRSDGCAHDDTQGLTSRRIPFRLSSGDSSIIGIIRRACGIDQGVTSSRAAFNHANVICGTGQEGDDLVLPLGEARASENRDITGVGVGGGHGEG